MITVELIRELFTYKEGQLFYTTSKHRPGTKRSGDLAGRLDKSRKKSPKGIWVVNIKGKAYKLALIIFIHHRGFIPWGVRHVDRDARNNLRENLVEVKAYATPPTIEEFLASHNLKLTKDGLLPPLCRD